MTDGSHWSHQSICFYRSYRWMWRRMSRTNWAQNMWQKRAGGQEPCFQFEMISANRVFDAIGRLQKHLSHRLENVILKSTGFSFLSCSARFWSDLEQTSNKNVKTERQGALDRAKQWKKVVELFEIQRHLQVEPNRIFCGPLVEII